MDIRALPQLIKSSGMHKPMKHTIFNLAAVTILAIACHVSGISVDLAKIKTLRQGGASSGIANDGDYANQMYSKFAGELFEDEFLSSSTTERANRSFSEIDRSIDEKTYVLGSNDELVIYIWGSVNEIISGTVDNEGSLVIQSVGAIKVGGITLALAKYLVKKKMLEVYRNVEITVTLGKVRNFRAYILGEVQNPGGYVVNGATRISDLIDMAGGPVKKDECRMRGIEIANENGEMRFADLVAFYQNNDISRNPYLSEGDRVFIRKRRDIVSISGEITYPGTYDYIEGDLASNLIKAAGGTTRNADSLKISLTRFTGSTDEVENISFSMSEAGGLELKSDDRILIGRKADYRIQRNVWVAGEVMNPGKYPVSKEGTKLSTVIDMAGGFTDEALLSQSFLFRKRRFMKRDDEFEVLEGVPMTSLTPLEKGYIKAKYMGKDGMFSMNFSNISAGGDNTDNVLLIDGDSIVISRRNHAVEVNGAVTTPGLVAYRKGQGTDFYIKNAGGYNKRAKRFQTMLIRGNTGVWLRPNEADEVREGDIILVPEREYKEFTKVARDVLVILSSIAAVITAYIAVSNSINNSK
jgi:protein involved in polysaccharide export with SLBB domain